MKAFENLDNAGQFLTAKPKKDNHFQSEEAYTKSGGHLKHPDIPEVSKFIIHEEEDAVGNGDNAVFGTKEISSDGADNVSEKDINELRRLISALVTDDYVSVSPQEEMKRTFTFPTRPQDRDDTDNIAAALVHAWKRRTFRRSSLVEI